MLRFGLLSAICFPLVSLASSFAITVPGGINLEHQGYSDIAAADVRVREGQIWSRGGIRLSAEQEFAPNAPMILQSPLEVRDANGHAFKLVIWEVKEGHATVELIDEKKNAEVVEPPRGPTRRFHLAEMSLNGETAHSAYPDLILRPDGTYRFGAAQGHWAETDDTVTLDGYYEAWGVASISNDQQLTFDFRRGGHRFQMRMERTPETSTESVATK